MTSFMTNFIVPKFVKEAGTVESKGLERQCGVVVVCM